MEAAEIEGEWVPGLYSYANGFRKRKLLAKFREGCVGVAESMEQDQDVRG